MNKHENWFYIKVVLVFFFVVFVVLFTFCASVGEYESMEIPLLILVFGFFYLVALIFHIWRHKKKQIQNKLEMQQTEDEFFQKYYQKK